MTAHWTVEENKDGAHTYVYLVCQRGRFVGAWMQVRADTLRDERLLAKRIMALLNDATFGDGEGELK